MLLTCSFLFSQQVTSMPEPSIPPPPPPTYLQQNTAPPKPTAPPSWQQPTPSPPKTSWSQPSAPPVNNANSGSNLRAQDSYEDWDDDWDDDDDSSTTTETPVSHIDGLVQDCSNSSANALELPQSCTKPSVDICLSITATMETWRNHCHITTET